MSAGGAVWGRGGGSEPHTRPRVSAERRKRVGGSAEPATQAVGGAARPTDPRRSRGVYMKPPAVSLISSPAQFDPYDVDWAFWESAKAGQHMASGRRCTAHESFRNESLRSLEMHPVFAKGVGPCPRLVRGPVRTRLRSGTSVPKRGLSSLGSTCLQRPTTRWRRRCPRCRRRGATAPPDSFDPSYWQHRRRRHWLHSRRKPGCYERLMAPGAYASQGRSTGAGHKGAATHATWHGE